MSSGVMLARQPQPAKIELVMLDLMLRLSSTVASAFEITMLDDRSLTEPTSTTKVRSPSTLTGGMYPGFGM